MIRIIPIGIISIHETSGPQRKNNISENMKDGIQGSWSFWFGHQRRAVFRKSKNPEKQNVSSTEIVFIVIR
mgnify:CR=1 FL=1